MKNIIFLLFFFFQSCGFDNNDEQITFDQIPIQGGSTTTIDSSVFNNILPDTSNIDEDIYASENRDLWQQPDIIINYLGDLKDKKLADIGAGPNGYFTLIIASRTEVEKILAIDIDEEAIKIIDKYKHKLDESRRGKIETRLVPPNDPKLKEEEVDFILVSNTLTYIEDKLDYLKKLKKGLSKNGKILIIDSKMKKLPIIFPKRSDRMPLFAMEDLIEKAGFTHTFSDDSALDFQYIVLAKK